MYVEIRRLHDLVTIGDKIMRTVGPALALSLGLVGCATTPMDPHHAAQVPSERLLAFQEQSPETGATLIVTRDKGFLGGGCYYGFFINNNLAARFDVAESAKFYVKPDEIVLRSGRDPQGRSLCGAGQKEWTQRETVLQEGQTKYFRLSTDVNAKTDIQRADPAATP